jgi:DNA processing protein
MTPEFSLSVDDETRALLHLAGVKGLGPRLLHSALRRFGSPQAVLNASADVLAELNGVSAALAQRIAHAARDVSIEPELEVCRREEVSFVLSSRPDYPRLLREVPDPPPLLFTRGRFLEGDQLAIAIVGSRHATSYGRTQAERLAASLARAGLTIVSGLARGIDAAAHRGALAAGGRTIAVLASGVVDIYPPEHAELAREVALQGTLASEAPSGTRPHPGLFPQRNRIISGLSLGVIVVEAALRSGALITARHAGEQGREVFAVPGRVDSRASQGCHRLLKDGARLVETADDVLEELGPLVQPVREEGQPEVRRPAELLLSDQERQVLQAVGDDPTSIDAVISATGLAASQVLATLSALEVRRLIRRLAGSQVIRL